jgi:hypothetical protein
MGHFRKKPVVIEALRWDGTASGASAIQSALNGPLGQVTWQMIDGESRFCCDTLEGPLTVSPGDIIIRGVKGELYPCKPDIFEATYEEVPAPPATESEAPPHEAADKCEGDA